MSNYNVAFTIGGASGTGLSGIYCRPVSGTTLGSSISLTEVSGAGGLYVGEMTTGTAGHYVLLAFDATDQQIGASTISYYWDGTQFVGDDAISAIKTKTDQLTFTVSNQVDSTVDVAAIVAGVEGALVVPTVEEIREEIDDNSVELAAIKAAAIASKNLSAAGL